MYKVAKMHSVFFLILWLAFDVLKNSKKNNGNLGNQAPQHQLCATLPHSPFLQITLLPCLKHPQEKFAIVAFITFSSRISKYYDRCQLFNMVINKISVSLFSNHACRQKVRVFFLFDFTPIAVRQHKTTVERDWTKASGRATFRRSFFVFRFHILIKMKVTVN